MTKQVISGIIAAIIFVAFSACDNTNDDPNADYGILPEQFKVDVPSSLSHEILKSAQNDTLLGNQIYEHLKFFIAVGENAADLVEDIMFVIKAYNIEGIKDFTYLSDDDNRMKHLSVVADVEFNNTVWEYQLTVTDQQSESDPDGGIAMQVFWNNKPIEGIALVKPRNIDRLKNSDAEDAAFSIYYNANGNSNYDEVMEVEIAGLPLPNADIEPYALESMKMFVGKKGEHVDVYGNSNHPNAQFNSADTEAKGFNWAFVASAHNTKNIAVAEVGLPQSNSSATSREVLLVENSMKNVLTQEITNYIIAENPEFEGMESLIIPLLTPYLTNTEAPGFFDQNGFIQALNAPNSEYNELVDRIQLLAPYSPIELNNLEINFNPHND